MSPSTTRAVDACPHLRLLGVRGIINCRGTYTTLTGSACWTWSPGHAAASDQYVAMDELMARVGERLATLTGAGSATSPALRRRSPEVTAAAVAGTDPERMQPCPTATGMPNEVIIQAAHRNAYDRAIRLAAPGW
jgi:hypothetical protein